MTKTSANAVNHFAHCRLHSCSIGALVIPVVKLLSGSMRQGHRSRIAAAFLMLALWLSLGAVVVSPKLHRLVHKDAQTSTHNCVVTQLQQHSVTGGLAPVLAPVLSDGWTLQPASPELQVAVSSDHRLSPSRAPPAV